mmetsp:Transcript_23270/g.26952  ORF Transcript_23270/g.26952 Transcript_23270/m.26952 type:complete len:115 (+) Transcript_23270:16-360(+)
MILKKAFIVMTLTVHDKANLDSMQPAKRSDLSVQNIIEAREFRWRQQNLLCSPLRQHMKLVEAHETLYCGNTNGMMMTKSPFKLAVPSKQNEHLSSLTDNDIEESIYSHDSYSA